MSLTYLVSRVLTLSLCLLERLDQSVANVLITNPHEASDISSLVSLRVEIANDLALRVVMSHHQLIEIEMVDVVGIVDLLDGIGRDELIHMSVVISEFIIVDIISVDIKSIDLTIEKRLAIDHLIDELGGVVDLGVGRHVDSLCIEMLMC